MSKVISCHILSGASCKEAAGFCSGRIHFGWDINWSLERTGEMWAEWCLSPGSCYANNCKCTDKSSYHIMTHDRLNRIEQKLNNNGGRWRGKYYEVL